MTGWLHVLSMLVCRFVLPRCGFSVSSFRNHYVLLHVAFLESKLGTGGTCNTRRSVFNRVWCFSWLNVSRVTGRFAIE